MHAINLQRQALTAYRPLTMSCTHYTMYLDLLWEEVHKLFSCYLPPLPLLLLLLLSFCNNRRTSSATSASEINNNCHTALAPLALFLLCKSIVRTEVQLKGRQFITLGKTTTILEVTTVNRKAKPNLHELPKTNSGLIIYQFPGQLKSSEELMLLALCFL